MPNLVLDPERGAEEPFGEAGVRERQQAAAAVGGLGDEVREVVGEVAVRHARHAVTLGGAPRRRTTTSTATRRAGGSRAAATASLSSPSCSHHHRFPWPPRLGLCIKNAREFAGVAAALGDDTVARARVLYVRVESYT